MLVFEFTEKDSRRGTGRILIIGETYRAYEKEDGSVLLNDESAGYSFYPKETYEEFRKKVLPTTPEVGFKTIEVPPRKSIKKPS